MIAFQAEQKNPLPADWWQIDYGTGEQFPVGESDSFWQQQWWVIVWWILREKTNSEDLWQRKLKRLMRFIDWDI